MVTISGLADNLVAGDTNGFSDVFVLELETGAFTRISTSSGEAQALGGHSSGGNFSPDGTKVVFYKLRDQPCSKRTRTALAMSSSRT